ncbi:MAG: TetR/AcrR family transcriptional regulator [Actinomycetes bacterium]
MTMMNEEVRHARVRVHPTKQRLLEVVIELLDSKNLAEIKSEEVLAKADAVKGSMYYHFEDFSDLLESAQILSFSRHVEGVLDGLKNILLATADPQSARSLFDNEALRRKLNMSQKLRIERFSVVHGAMVSERMRAKLIPTQENLILRWMEIIDICKSRGWTDDQLDSRSVAILIQGANLSRVIDDISYSHVDSTAWFRTLTYLLDAFFFGGIKEIQS